MIAVVLAALLFVPVCIGILWLLYLAVMNLQQARDAGTLTAAGRRMGKLILFVGLVWDFLCNMLPVSIIFLELPREWLVTARVQRHVNTSNGWRYGTAVWFAVNMLNPFDLSGDHIILRTAKNEHHVP